jgi:TPR repeat protein
MRSNTLILLLRNARKTERGAKEFLTRLAVCAAPFALLASSALLRAQGDFGACQGAGTEILHQRAIANPQTEFCIGYLYAFGQGVPKNMATAVTHFRSAAERGFTPAQAVLGLNYAKGLGVAQNWTEAARWYRKAADGGHAGAAVNLGLCYQIGNGVPQDKAEAAKWYRFATAHGDPQAAALLTALSGGSAPSSGPREQAGAPANAVFQQGVKLYQAGDQAGALRYFQQAAQAGNSWAELQIGYQYQYGEGVPQNLSEAVRWYTRSAQHGNARGQKNLGQMYEEGGVAEDWVTAARWYQKSADQNWKNGQYALGRAYQFGIGVPQNRQKAIEWFQRAAANGDSEAAYFAQELSSPGNFIGFRNVSEHDRIIGGKLRFGLIFQEPAGILFHNSRERDAYLGGLRREVDVSEATAMWNIRKSEYDACRSGGGSNCQPPGPRPK